MLVKFKHTGRMAYKVLEETDDQLKIEYLDWVPRSLFTEVLPTDNLPSATDVMVKFVLK